MHSLSINYSLDTMGRCRIGWGRIKEIETTYTVVEHQPLVLECGKLKLGDLWELAPAPKRWCVL